MVGFVVVVVVAAALVEEPLLSGAVPDVEASLVSVAEPEPSAGALGPHATSHRIADERRRWRLHARMTELPT